MPWGVVAAVGGAVVSSALADDNGATGANDAAAASTRQQTQIANDQWETYKNTYQPLEKAYVAEAQNYDSPENYARAAGDASATVAEQFGKARDRLSRTPGLDPSSAGYAATVAGLDMSQAANDAVAQNAARNRVSDMAWARKTDAISLGKGLPAQASSGLAQSANTNMQIAANGQAQANQQGQAIGGLVSQGFNAYNKSKTPSSSPGLDSGGGDAGGGSSGGGSSGGGDGGYFQWDNSGGLAA